MALKIIHLFSTPVCKIVVEKSTTNVQIKGAENQHKIIHCVINVIWQVPTLLLHMVVHVCILVITGHNSTNMTHHFVQSCCILR